MFFAAKPTLSVYDYNPSEIPLRGFTLSLVYPNGEVQYLASHITTKKYLSDFREFLNDSSSDSTTARYSFGHNNFEESELNYDSEQMADELIDYEYRAINGLLEEKNPKALLIFRWVDKKLYVSCVITKLGSTYNLREEYEDDYGLNLIETSNEIFSMNLLIDDEQIRAYLDATK